MSKRYKSPNKKIDNMKAIEFPSQSELDFHLYGELTAYDIEKLLNEFIEDCYIDKLKYVLVITGKGRVVKPLVQRLLKTNLHIESFKQAGYFNGQDGAFEVVIK